MVSARKRGCRLPEHKAPEYLVASVNFSLELIKERRGLSLNHDGDGVLPKTLEMGPFS